MFGNGRSEFEISSDPSALVPFVTVRNGRKYHRLAFWRLLAYNERLEQVPNELFFRAVYQARIAGSLTYVIMPPFSTMYFAVRHEGTGDGFNSKVAAFDSALEGYYRGLKCVPCGYLGSGGFSGDALRQALYAPTFGVDPRNAKLVSGPRGTPELLLPPDFRCPRCGGTAIVDLDGVARCESCVIEGNAKEHVRAVQTGWRAFVFLFLADISGEGSPAYEGLRPYLIPPNIYGMPELPQIPAKPMMVDKRMSELLDEISKQGLNCTLTVAWRPADTDSLSHRIAKLNAHDTALVFASEQKRITGENYHALLGGYNYSAWVEDPLATQLAQYAAVQVQRYTLAEQDGKFDVSVVFCIGIEDTSRERALSRAEDAVEMVRAAISHLKAGKLEVLRRPDRALSALLSREVVKLPGGNNWLLGSELSVLVHVPKFPQPSLVEKYVIPSFDLTPANIGQFNTGPSIGVVLKDGVPFVSGGRPVTARLDVQRSLVRMLAIFGKPGYGKSTTMCHLLRQLIDEWKCKVLILDRHNEYSRLVKLCAEPIAVVNPCDPRLDFHINLFEPPEGIDFETHYRALCELLPYILCYVSPGFQSQVGPVMYYVIESALSEVYSQFGFDVLNMKRTKLTEPKVYPTLSDFYGIIEKWYMSPKGIEELTRGYARETAGDAPDKKQFAREAQRIRESLGSVVARLKPLQRGFAFRVFNPPDGRSTISIRELLDHNIVFELGKGGKHHLFDLQSDTEFQEGEVPDSLRKSFAEHGFTLSGQASISRTNDTMWSIRDTKKVYFVKKARKGFNVYEGMKGLEDFEANFLSILILYQLYSYRMRNKILVERGEHPHVTVVEEAHNVVVRIFNVSSSVQALTVADKMLIEMRKYGEAVMVVDQSPANVSGQVMRMCNTVIVHRTDDVMDLESIVNQLRLDRSGADYIAYLPVGVAVCKLDGSQGPISVQVPNVECLPEDVSSDEIERVLKRVFPRYGSEPEASHQSPQAPRRVPKEEEPPSVTPERVITQRHADVLQIIDGLMRSSKPPDVDTIASRYALVHPATNPNADVLAILKELERLNLIRPERLSKPDGEIWIYPLSKAGEIFIAERLPAIRAREYLDTKYRVVDSPNMDFVFVANERRIGVKFLATLKRLKEVKAVARSTHEAGFDKIIVLVPRCEANDAAKAEVERALREAGAALDRISVVTFEELTQVF